MTERWRGGSPARWESIVGYSRVVRVGPQVSVTGTIALDDEGQPVEGGAVTQTRRVLVLLERALRRVGATPADVVRTRIFVTDIANDWEVIGRAHGELFGAVRPATSMVEVSALIEPWAKVEIEADAWIGGSPVRDAPNVTIRAAEGSAMGALLDAAGLPPAAPDAVVWVAEDEDGTVVAAASTVAVESDVLLRSCVVHPERRREGIGALLVDVALLRAQAAGAGRAFLATETASSFFGSIGFAEAASLPGAVAARVPQVCAGATLMVRLI